MRMEPSSVDAAAGTSEASTKPLALKLAAEGSSRAGVAGAEGERVGDTGSGNGADTTAGAGGSASEGGRGTTEAEEEDEQPGTRAGSSAPGAGTGDAAAVEAGLPAASIWATGISVMFSLKMESSHQKQMLREFAGTVIVATVFGPPATPGSFTLSLYSSGFSGTGMQRQMFPEEASFGLGARTRPTSRQLTFSIPLVLSHDLLLDSEEEAMGRAGRAAGGASKHGKRASQCAYFRAVPVPEIERAGIGRVGCGEEVRGFAPLWARWTAGGGAGLGVPHSVGGFRESWGNKYYSTLDPRSHRR
jgi:hypothetical protein